MPLVFEMVKLLVVDAIFLGLCAGALMLLSNVMKTNAAFAVMRRNFVGYFSNPTGYVFLCLFVLLTSVAAFCPHEFFAANLANLDQLNKYLPYIMLVFIPAITMSIWAEERRQGTDELLLTLPATDFDIVIGKFLSAAAIFTCSLLFSQVSNYVVLIALSLGDLDSGLLLSTYFGYWLVGLAMISLGMVASFLTSNLTVGFILGALINAPLAFASHADTLAASNVLSRSIARWGLLDRMDDFGRGVLSLSSFTYFALIIVVGLYFSMVLIGRRHWSGGSDGTSMLGHYLVRAISIAMVGVGLVLIFTWKDFRADVTEGKISSLSKDTQQLLRSLDTNGRKIYIDAYVGAEMPDSYVKTKFELLSMLKEFASRAPDKISLTLHEELERFSEKAKEADEHGIRPEPIRTLERGQIHDHEVIMGAVFRCGLDKVTVPFFDYGIPVEYELIRSINTVAQDSRKRVGVVRTAANMFGGITMMGGQPQSLPQREIIGELGKQYDVRSVDPSSPIPTDEYDALIVVQPSSLPPAGMENLLAAIRAGVPTAVFEDPRPTFIGGVPATAEDNQPMGGMMMMGIGGGPQPKGDIRQLWDLLGIQAPGTPGGPSGFQPDIVWQSFNPYPKLEEAANVNDSWVFASTQSPNGENSISMGDKITSNLTELFFPMPGAIEKKTGSNLKFTPLVSTNSVSGHIKFDDLMDVMRTGGDKMEFRKRQGKKIREQILAARIRGELADDDKLMQGPDPDADEAKAAAKEGGESKSDDKAGEKADEKEAKDTGPKPLNVVYVADIDLMSDTFLRLRARPDDVGLNLNFRFENVTFLLNIVDELVGQTDYVSIRKRKPHLTTLKLVEYQIRESRQFELEKEREYREEFDREVKQEQTKRDKAVEERQKAIEELERKQQKGEAIDYAEVNAAQVKYQTHVYRADQELEVTRARLEQKRSRALKDLRDETERSVRQVQNTYKMWSVFVPPIPPLLVGLIVLVQRRLRERDTVSRDPARRV
ncbi:MAG: Gldg family protein [Planctomycetales bacterium]|nr:Gldg family protein [Planctomycetales bacterium]